ncbi:RNA polymerase sigma factor (sigma-70 family) [Arthrobacter sp. CAN_A212]|uniref:LuxR C-terminal-related transcriptional regulator n=1 Tax=unclassified Arthrobacter TaxID=235627 RepID=UPI0018C9B29C|nr:LuxR C-terminal-related transcriptional regulator [Arthrobacter sp. CAN_C5]MBP2217900.1 RNA polymerase sigma factor (sigma-70 family) [Arthrobacter sp. CAN_C5]
MKQTDDNPSHSTLRRVSSAPTETHHHSVTSGTSGKRNLSDREAVIAVWVANGLTCETIASRLSVPLGTVEQHLDQALEILGLPDTEDLTYTVVASHYHRNAPTAPNGPEQPAVDPSDHVESPSGELSRPLFRSIPVSPLNVPDVSRHAITGNHLNSLVALDAAEELQTPDQEPARDTGPSLMASTSPADLLRAVGEGDRVAFSHFYHLTATRAFRMISNLVDHSDLNLQIMQDTYVEVWKRAKSFDAAKDSAMSWVVAIAHQLAVEALHERLNSSDAQSEPAGFDGTDLWSDPSGGHRSRGGPLVEQAQVAQESTHRAVDDVSVLERECLNAVFLRAMTYQEASAALRLPSSTVKKNIRQGTAHLERIREASAAVLPARSPG